jgi:hypothetical protein
MAILGIIFSLEYVSMGMEDYTPLAAIIFFWRLNHCIPKMVAVNCSDT